MRVWFEWCVVTAIFLSFARLADLFPYSGDDWAWGSQIGLDRLATFFTNYNGRYMGNLVVLVLTRSSVLATFTMAAAVTAMIFMVLHIARCRTIAGYALVYGLVLAMPVAVWRQGVVWTSGFSNYFLASISMLGIIVWTRSILGRDQAARRPRHMGEGAGLFILAFVGQLFIEHVTIFIVAFALGSVLYAARRAGRIPILLWFQLAGATLGAAVMFSNGAYRRALTGSSTYQQIGQEAGSKADQALAAVDRVIGPYGVTLNTALNVALLALVSIIALGRCYDRVRGVVAARYAVIGSVTGMSAVLVAFFVPREASQLTILGIWGPICLVLTLCSAALVVPDRGTSRMMILIVLVFIVLIAPLVVVKPLGPRCFIPTYVLFLIAVAALARIAVGTLRSSGAWVLTIVALSLLIPNFVNRYDVYRDIDTASTVRVAQARKAVDEGTATVLLKRLPQGGVWVHVPDPISEPWVTRYKLFYGLPRTLEIKIQ